LRQESRDARERWEIAKKAHEKDPKNSPPPGEEPPRSRAIVKDITRESLVIVLEDNPRGVLCDPDEASAWVGSFNEYKGKAGSDRQFWLSVWSCSAVSVDRRSGRESHSVPYPFISVVGGLPPSMLGSLSEERGRDDGFQDRIMFVYPDDVAFPSQHWTEADLSEETAFAWTEAIEILHNTPMVWDEKQKRDRPHFVELTPEAHDEWVSWFNGHADEAEHPDFPDGQAGAWSKLRAHAARFALILSRLRCVYSPLAPDQAEPISAEDIRGAVALVDFFKGHLTRVRHEVTGGLFSANAKQVLSWIKRRRKPSFREADVGTDLRRFRDEPDALSAALKALVGIGAIRTLKVPRPRGPGRKGSTKYEVHPDLLLAPDNPENTAKAATDAPESRDSGKSGKSWRVLGDDQAREVFEL
jgi:hypothetical protein